MTGPQTTVRQVPPRPIPPRQIQQRPILPWPAGTLLGRLSDRAGRALLELGAEVRVPAGRRLIRQGEPGRTAYLLLGGCVKILGNGDAREPLLGVRVAGDLVGELAFLARLPRSSTVLTGTATTARAIPGADLQALLRRDAEVTFEVAAMIGERLRWSNDRRVDFAALQPRARVARVLLTLADAHGRRQTAGTDLGTPLTQEEIAALAGTRLATAERALRAMAVAGIVRPGYRRIVITDLAALRAAAQVRA